MRILHVVPSYMPAWRYGGPIRSVHGLARAQVAAGDEVDVFTTDADGAGSLAVPTDRPVDRDGVRVHYFRCGRPRRLYRSPALGRALHSIDRFDLVHLHSVFLWPTLAAARRSSSSGVPYLLSPRGMLVRDLIAERGFLRKQLWIRLFERETLRRAAFVVATSDYEVREMRRLGLDLAPVEVVPNGVALDYGEDDLGGSAALDRFLAEGPYFLFLGRLARKKRLEELVSDVAAVPGARLAIAGGDDDGLSGKLRAAAQAAGAGERIWLAGEVRGDTKVRLLRECRALILPSSSENFGNVVLEALAAGRPAIVSDGVGLARDLSSRSAGRVVDGSREDMRRALLEFLGDPLLAAAMGRRGRDWIENELSWERVAKRMSTVYRRAVRTSDERS
jgi:glycosyltransferase involved in cell wall biosynthesis